MSSEDKDNTDIPGGSAPDSINVWIDRLIPKLGNPGRYQICLCMLILVAYLPVVINHMVMAIYGWKFPFVCDPNAGNYSSYRNYTLNKCDAALYDNLENNNSVPCNSGQWRYMKDEAEETIVTEFDLVCDKEDYMNLATTIYFIGVLVGGVSFGHIADSFGRKSTFIVTVIAPLVIGVGVRFAPSYIVFVVLRFIIGFFIQGQAITVITLCVEMLQSKHRGDAIVTSEVIWGLSEVMIAGMAYLFASWRDIQLMICVTSLVVLVYIAFVPESYRWLLLRGEAEKAEQIVRRMSRVNKLEFPEDIWQEVKSLSLKRKGSTDDNSIRTYSLYDLIRTPEVRKRTFIACYFWFTGTMSYFGTVIQISNFAGDRHLNILISGVVTLVGAAMIYPFLRLLGRKQCIVMYSLISGICCIVAGALPIDEDAEVDYDTMKTAFALVGKCALVGCMTLTVLYSQEIFPTVIRGIAFGSATTFGRVGSLLAPQIDTLGKYTAKAFPMIFFGSLLLIMSVLGMLGPETRFKKLPDTIKDIENTRNNNGTENEGYDNEIELNQMPAPNMDQMNKEP